MPGRKSSLADRYLAAIQGSNRDDSKEGVPGDAAGVAGKKVNIEYTYRPPANNADGGNTNGNTTATGSGDGDEVNKRAVNVFPTSSTEEETTTDEEDGDNNSSSNKPSAAVKKREGRAANADDNSSPNNNDQLKPEFATIPLRRVGATATATTAANNNKNSSGNNSQRRLNSVASSDLLSEASEPIPLKKKDDGDGNAPDTDGGADGTCAAADNDGHTKSQAMEQNDDNDEDEDNYSFKPIEGMEGITGVAKADVSTENKPASNDSGNGGSADGKQGGGGGKVKLWASKINCRADTTAASSVVGVPAQSNSLASPPLMSPLACVQPPVVGGGTGGDGGAMRKASASDGDNNVNSADADDMASALRKSATMVKGSASPGRRRNGSSSLSSSMSDRKKQILRGHQQQKQQKQQKQTQSQQSPLREKEIWQRRRKERERRATQLRQKEEEDNKTDKTDGSGSVVSVPVSTLSTPATEVHTNRTSDFRRNLWLDRSSAAATAAADEGGTSGADGDDEGANGADVANPQEEETDSESDNPDLAADAEVRRLSQSESERAAARVTTTGKGGKASSFAPVGGRVTPLMTEVGAEKHDEGGDDEREKSAQVAGVKVDKSRGELNSALGAMEKSKGELDSAHGTSRPPRTPQKVSVKPGLVAARQKAFSGGSSGTNKIKSSAQKYRTKKSLADDISHADSSVATPAVAMTDDIVDAEVDDVAEPLPQGFTPSIKADVSLTSSTDVELGVIGEETLADDDNEGDDPLTGKSFKVNRASRNTGKKKKKNATSVAPSPDVTQPTSTSSVPSSPAPAWAQVKLRKTPRGAALQQTADARVVSTAAVPSIRNENSPDSQSAQQKSEASTFPVQSLRSLPSEAAHEPQSPPTSPNRTPLVLPDTKSPPWTDRSSAVESHTASSVDWAPAQLSPGPFSAGKEAPAFQDGPPAPILLGQEYISRRVTSSVQQKRVVRSKTTTAMESTVTKPVSHNDLRPRRVESFMSEDSEGVQSLRHKFEANVPYNGENDQRKQQSIRMKFEEMASPSPSGREAVTNARQVFEKKTVRDRAPQQVPLCDAVFQQYDCDVDGQPNANAEDTPQNLPTPKGVRDVRSTFEPEPKRFSPEKMAQRRPPQGRQSAMRRGIDTAPGGDDDAYRSRIDNWMAEVKEIRSKFDSKPDPPPRRTNRAAASDLSKADSKDSGDRSQPPTPRWLDIDTKNTVAVNDSPFKSYDAQAKKISAMNPPPRTPHGQSFVRRTGGAARSTSMASKASWPSSGGGWQSTSSAIDFEDAVTLSPQSTVVSELTPSTLPSNTMADNQSRGSSYGAASSTAAARTPTLSFLSPSGTPVRLELRKTTPNRKAKARRATSEVIPRSPDPPGKTETTPRKTDPPESLDKVDVSISPIPYRSSPKEPAPVPDPSPTEADNQDSRKKMEADTAWTDFDAFGGADPFDSSFTADFSADFNAFQSGGASVTTNKSATSSTKKTKAIGPNLDEILSPPRVTKSFDSEGSVPLDDAISISTANTPLRSNITSKGNSVSFDISDELGLSTRPIRPKHVLTNDATSAVSKRLDELKEARRARQSGLSQTRSDGDSKASSQPTAPPSALRSKSTKYKATTASSPPRSGITSKLSQVARIGKKSPLRGKGCQKETAEMPLSRQEDRYLLFDGGTPVPLADSPQQIKKKRGSKGKGLSRFASNKAQSVRKRLSGEGR